MMLDIVGITVVFMMVIIMVDSDDSENRGEAKDLLNIPGGIREEHFHPRKGRGNIPWRTVC